MAYIIDCHHVSVVDDEACTVVTFADHPEMPSRWVMIQRALSYDEQDRRLGMDGIYLEVEDQSRSVYRGIEAMRFEPDYIEIRLGAEAVQQLAVEGEIVLRLNAQAVDTTEALEKLREFARAEKIEILPAESR